VSKYPGRENGFWHPWAALRANQLLPWLSARPPDRAEGAGTTGSDAGARQAGQREPHGEIAHIPLASPVSNHETGIYTGRGSRDGDLTSRHCGFPGCLAPTMTSRSPAPFARRPGRGEASEAARTPWRDCPYPACLARAFGPSAGADRPAHARHKEEQP
jgi:hypothetical protein